MARQALAEVRRHPRRLAAVLVAVVLAVGYLVASVSVLATEQATVERGVIARTSGTDVVVTLRPAARAAQQRVVSAVETVPGVRSADLSLLSRGRVAGSSEWLQLQSVPGNPALRWSTLATGRWPQRPDEIVLWETTARQLGVGVGERLAVHDTASSATLTVTGLTARGNSLLADLTQSSFVAPAFYTERQSVRTSLQTEVLVVGDGSVDDRALAGDVRARAAGQQVETTASFTRRKLSEQTNGVLVFQVLLLVFGAIALLVGSMMIVTTFLALVSQRRRQYGLLRAVGASQRQVRRAVLGEALLVGLAGVVGGSAVGIALAALAARLLDEPLVVPVAVVAVVAAVGVGTTVVAALVPARRAAQLSPLDALRPVLDEMAAARAGRVRLAGSALAALLGTLAIAAAWSRPGHALPLHVVGAGCCAVALLAMTASYLPWMTRAAGQAVRGAGPVGRLAVANVLRHPGRAAGTAMALMLAVGLVVTLQVGAASMKATVSSSLGERFPVDLTVSMLAGALPQDAVEGVSRLPGVVAAEGIRTTRVRLQAQPRDGSNPAGRGAELRLLGPSPQAAHTVAAGFATVRPDVLLADPVLMAARRLRAGQAVRVTGPSGALVLPVRGSALAPADALVLPESVLLRLDAHAPTGAVWAAVSDGVDITQLRAGLRAVAAPVTGADVGGALSAKESYTVLLDRLLAVTTALLGVAVLIAVVGVTNMLGLSVLERTRESGVLRALGMQRRELRVMLALEALLLSGCAAVVGVLAGVFFGVLGTQAVASELNLGSLHVAVSPGQTVLVVLAALGAGVLASVLPALRAARALPVQALADA